MTDDLDVVVNLVKQNIKQVVKFTEPKVVY